MPPLAFTVIWQGRRLGIVASQSYNEFIDKCKKKFLLKKHCTVYLTLEDNTEIDEDYFPCIDNGETLLLQSASPSNVLLHSLEQFLQRCMENEPNISGPLTELLEAGSLQEFHQFIASVSVSSHDEARLSKREEHPHWFEGVADRQRTKESWLRGSAECRIRSYYGQLQRELRAMVVEAASDAGCCDDRDAGRSDDRGSGRSDVGQTHRTGSNGKTAPNGESDTAGSDESDEEVSDKKKKFVTAEVTDHQENLQEAVESVLSYFKARLKADKYHQSYFDRSCPCPASRLCGPEGVFCCDGEYNKASCAAHHHINPYASRELRIVFSTWNLDHMVEKSRSVIPTLKRLLLAGPVADINLPYFFDLLFTKHSRAALPAGRGDSADGGDGVVLRGAVASGGEGIASGGEEEAIAAVTIPTGFTVASEQLSNAGDVHVTGTVASLFHSNVRECCKDDSKEVHKLHYKSGSIEEGNNITHDNFFANIVRRSECDDFSVDEVDGNGLHTSNGKKPASSDGQSTSTSKSSIAQASTSVPTSPRWNGNLKLVHIACHIKLPHDVRCDARHILTERSQGRTVGASRRKSPRKVPCSETDGLTSETDGAMKLKCVNQAAVGSKQINNREQSVVWPVAAAAAGSIAVSEDCSNTTEQNSTAMKGMKRVASVRDEILKRCKR